MSLAESVAIAIFVVGLVVCLGWKFAGRKMKPKPIEPPEDSVYDHDSGDDYPRRHEYYGNSEHHGGYGRYLN